MGEYPPGSLYRPSFQSHLMPGRLRHLARHGGCASAAVPLRTICDLGCGAGLTAIVFAAAHPETQVWGIDRNAEQINAAEALARRLGFLNVRFVCADIEDIQALDLPAFDLIALSGVFSWISETMRERVYDFVSRRAAEGGFVYIHYMSTVGWASYAPIISLIAALTEHVGFDVARAERLAEKTLTDLLGGGYLTHHEVARTKVKEFLREQPDMRIHHFLNPNFSPLPAEAVHGKMKDARFAFLGDCVNMADRAPATTGPLEEPQQADPNGVLAGLIDELTNFRLDRHDLFQKAEASGVRQSGADESVATIFPGFGDPLIIYRTRMPTLGPGQKELGDAILSLVGDRQMTPPQIVDALSPQFASGVITASIDMLIGAGILVPLAWQSVDPDASRRDYVAHARRWVDEVIETSLLDRRRRIFVSPALAYGFRATAEEMVAIHIADRFGLDRFDHQACRGLVAVVAGRYPAIERATFSDKVLDLVLYFACEKRQLLRLLGVTG
jgi:SAM-dependent methyltransferase